ncbi:uncharacterized protein LOC111099863 [Crassostrea virginica]|uniref:Protein shisa-4-like n=1 Tax=Crassostrea virginica TaxID=6565 RepID=A0A8B8A8W6_CRAVI|nr:protein shisa-4-like [Crassostrea virginica]
MWSSSLAFLLFILNGCYAGEYCKYIYEGRGSVKYMYCDVTCCGYYYNRYCCNVSSTALYIGAVVGGVICVVLIIGIVVCCVYKGKTPVRRHRHVDETPQEELQSARIYAREPPKPPPYSIHYLHPPEYHADPPPRYVTPIPPPSDYSDLPGTMSNE